MLIFFILTLISKNINFSSLIGEANQFFTLFQFFGPTAGAFLGPWVGGVAVLFSQLADFLLMGKEMSLVSILRFLPMLFAVYYFGSKRKITSSLICLVSIFLFVIHPVGREVWFLSFFWLIPILGKVLPDKMKGALLLRSFGATFTAHAVGSAIWIYTVPMTAGQWVSLVPIIAYERFLFGLGIAGSYIIFNTVLDFLICKLKLKVPTSVLFLEKKYTLSKLSKTINLSK